MEEQFARVVSFDPHDRVTFDFAEDKLRIETRVNFTLGLVLIVNTPSAKRDMEKGSLRCDANVSVRRAGSTELGTKTELKNMNSFKFLGEGMAAEIRRQIAVLEDGGSVVQETLHYDPGTRSLRTLRSKEEAHDYRYFPEPDLVPLAPTGELIERMRVSLPELPAVRIARFRAEFALPPQYATDLNAEGQVAD